MIQACVFDLDGTLVNTLPSLTYSVGETLKELGLSPIDEETCARFIGNGARKLVERSLAYTGGDPVGQLDKAMEIYSRVFKEGCIYQVYAYPGIPELLQALKERGIKLAVYSNKPHAETVKVIETVFGTGLFAEIRGQTEAVPRKPDPTGLLSLLADLGVDRDETLYIGDSEVDIETGKAAKIRTLTVTWGFRSRQALTEAGAELFVDRPEEILQYGGLADE